MDKTTGEDISMQADPLRWKALTVVCAAFFMTILDVSIVNVALPSIGKSLDFSRRSEEHTSELQSRLHLVCRLLLEKKKKTSISYSVPLHNELRTLCSEATIRKCIS